MFCLVLALFLIKKYTFSHFYFLSQMTSSRKCSSWKASSEMSVWPKKAWSTNMREWEHEHCTVLDLTVKFEWEHLPKWQIFSSVEFLDGFYSWKLFQHYWWFVCVMFCFRALTKDVERFAAEESSLRQEKMDSERIVALIRHDLKEVGWRKLIV